MISIGYMASDLNRQLFALYGGDMDFIEDSLQGVAGDGVAG